MQHLDNFKKHTHLIAKYGEEKAHLIWSMGLYLDLPDLEQLATESITDGYNDKKIDFVRLDLENKLLTVAQGTYSSTGVYKAKSNKASDLNTAFAWILSGDAKSLRTDESGKFENSLREITLDIRKAIEEGNIEEIEILYTHNMAESKNVRDELDTAKSYLEKALEGRGIIITAKELGIENLERIYRLKETAMVVKDNITLPEQVKFEENNIHWRAGIFTINGEWLKGLYEIYGDGLFSANYRGFLGVSRRGRKKINSGIRETADNKPKDFWAYNNGITILTTRYYPDPKNGAQTILEGISIINGAQTTGSLFHASRPANLKDVKVLCRVIESGDDATINSIIEYNNTQNAITTWDRYSKAEEQARIYEEFKKLGYDYSFKRGFGSAEELSIEVVAQPVTALHGNYLDAGSGKNTVFDKGNLYNEAFKDSKAKHLLLAYCLLKAVDQRRFELKIKNDVGKCTKDELEQLALLRYLRFKYFLLSIIGDCFENIVSEGVDKHQVAFENGVAGSSHNSIDNLVQLCFPVVKTILGFVANSLNKDFSELMYDKDDYAEVRKRVTNAIEGVKNSGVTVFSDFAKTIAPKG